jgi:hypothetical protein
MDQTCREKAFLDTKHSLAELDLSHLSSLQSHEAVVNCTLGYVGMSCDETLQLRPKRLSVVVGQCRAVPSILGKRFLGSKFRSDLD